MRLKHANYAGAGRLVRDLNVGERKFATVLFADIVDSSTLVVRADPEDANEKLLPWLQAIVEAIDDCGGTVTQLLGDGVMALFGAPASEEDHAILACLAAREAQRRCAQTEKGSSDGIPYPVQLRVGISSGVIVTQPIRSGMLTEYRAVGDTVHLAARAEEAAEPGQILLTEHTYSLVDGLVFTKPGKTIQLSKGSGAVRTFVLDPGREDHRDPNSIEALDTEVGKRLSVLRSLKQASPVTFVERGGKVHAIPNAKLGGAARPNPADLSARLAGQRLLVHQILDELESANVPHLFISRLQAYARALVPDEPIYYVLDGPMTIIRKTDPHTLAALEQGLKAGIERLVQRHDELEPLILPPEDSLPPVPQPDLDFATTDEIEAHLVAAEQVVTSEIGRAIVDESVADVIRATTDLVRVAGEHPCAAGSPETRNQRLSRIRRALIVGAGVIGTLASSAGLHSWAASPEGVALVNKLKPILSFLLRFFGL